MIFKKKPQTTEDKLKEMQVGEMISKTGEIKEVNNEKLIGKLKRNKKKIFLGVAGAGVVVSTAVLYKKGYLSGLDRYNLEKIGTKVQDYSPHDLPFVDEVTNNV